ncbi:hypothetical protein MTR67_006562 [Solanum verrucosum]|uniref:Uncharacterized protein n=1 Tax=Solanum verrucosum TaxID=315347 RepID=A0AAF0T9T9_SOLVR|nr:hypothetical protein MTR67_006562 [Solanum verrucosum]
MCFSRISCGDKLVLSSISDISLLELLPNLMGGRPNRYCKVLKFYLAIVNRMGSVLYLGIDDYRQDVGITANALQVLLVFSKSNNPSRVLHSPKESLLRISLAHRSASFKIVDIERFGNRSFAYERHPHRYEVDPDMAQQFEDADLSFTGKDESDRHMENCKETASFCRSYLRGASTQSSHQCAQSSTQNVVKGVFSDERPSVKMKFVNIWNRKLQTQGDCTSTCDGESKEGKPFLPFVPDLNKSRLF